MLIQTKSTKIILKIELIVLIASIGYLKFLELNFLFERPGSNSMPSKAGVSKNSLSLIEPKDSWLTFLKWR